MAGISFIWGGDAQEWEEGVACVGSVCICDACESVWCDFPGTMECFLLLEDNHIIVVEDQYGMISTSRTGKHEVVVGRKPL